MAAGLNLRRMIPELSHATITEAMDDVAQDSFRGRLEGLCAFRIEFEIQIIAIIVQPLRPEPVPIR
jgi:hypothetical protein